MYFEVHVKHTGQYGGGSSLDLVSSDNVLEAGLQIRDEYAKFFGASFVKEDTTNPHQPIYFFSDGNTVQILEIKNIPKKHLNLI